MGFNSSIHQGGHQKQNSPGSTHREGHELGRPPPSPGGPSGGHVWKVPFIQNRGGSKTRESIVWSTTKISHQTSAIWCTNSPVTFPAPPPKVPVATEEAEQVLKPFRVSSLRQVVTHGWNCPTCLEGGKHPPLPGLSIPGSREGVAIRYRSTWVGRDYFETKKWAHNWSFQVSHGFHISSSMASCDHPGDLEDNHLLGVHRHFRQDMSPLQLRCLSSVSNFSTSCHCQRPQGCCQTGALNFHPTRCVYNLSWDLKSRSVDQSILLDKFCRYKVNIKFRLTLGPQSTKTAGKNEPSTAEKKNK